MISIPEKAVTEAELVESAVGKRVTLQDIEASVINQEFFHSGTLTLCIITLQNGFKLIGESACALPENYNKSIGERLALADALRQVWKFLGYALCEKTQQENNLIDNRLFDAQDDGFDIYIGTKTLHAKPMNRRDYNALRGWDMPKNENGDDEGYLVEYTDKIQDPPHVPGYLGYISWSPKDVFEGAYKKV